MESLNVKCVIVCDCELDCGAEQFSLCVTIIRVGS